MLTLSVLNHRLHFHRCQAFNWNGTFYHREETQQRETVGLGQHRAGKRSGNTG